MRARTSEAKWLKKEIQGKHQKQKREICIWKRKKTMAEEWPCRIWEGRRNAQITAIPYTLINTIRLVTQDAAISAERKNNGISMVDESAWKGVGPRQIASSPEKMTNHSILQSDLICCRKRELFRKKIKSRMKWRRKIRGRRAVSKKSTRKLSNDQTSSSWMIMKLNRTTSMFYQTITLLTTTTKYTLPTTSEKSSNPTYHQTSAIWAAAAKRSPKSY